MIWAQVADNAGAEGGQVGQILTPALWMAGVLLAGAILLTILKRIQSRREAAQPVSAQEQLAQFRAARDKGEISADEYQRLKALLAGQIREQPVVAPKAKPEGKASVEKADGEQADQTSDT